MVDKYAYIHFSLLGHTASVLTVKFANKGMQLLSGAADGLIRLWTIRFIYICIYIDIYIYIYIYIRAYLITCMNDYLYKIISGSPLLPHHLP
jgi:WD40 repeat protein